MKIYNVIVYSYCYGEEVLNIYSFNNQKDANAKLVSLSEEFLENTMEPGITETNIDFFCWYEEDAYSENRYSIKIITTTI